ncbi:ribosome biogenesis GTPase Der [Phenylobacterium aquaticum]|jgi:GTP-binding protein|uniref:ribosome biogenesis GTPase Der n=1 Tax=Phenylobacterium aquaticum TaxID=1763816 RepID=UPI001F5DF3EE|nr:ribosome biogenesis GTPase Der [Phenylobacterium aquaticum]MCI3133857.1 ribosome biogenesis GTPase Der [Phenylobacterium aquaticum]
MPLRLAIVGRPNVGKSTLFNRLAGKKLAIVDDRPGVTRDRRFGTGRIGDIDLELIDTAGFEDVTDDSLEARMRAQTELAIDECDVAVFVVDSREGVTPMDQVFAEILRKRDKPVILLANKAEGRQGDVGINEAYSLGLGEPIAVSAEHGEGMADLYAAVSAINDEADLGGEDEGDKAVKIAIVGRPNAGKSTLVNKLIGEDRMLTGPEAGITRDAIPVDWTWEDRQVRLVDTAGLRRKARVQEKLEKLSTADSIRAITFAEVVILVMDATHPFEVQDLQIADLVEREGRALVFCLAKWDLVDDQNAKMTEIVEEAARLLPQLKGSPVIALSAETGRNLDKLMPAVFKVHKDWSTKVKTRDLNDWLAQAIQRHPPPAVGGHRVKPKYMAQTKARPPTFVLFASRANQLPDQYRRYLINSLRESFDLPGVPMRLTVKSNKNPFAEGEALSRPTQERVKKTRTKAKTGLAAKTLAEASDKAKAGAKAKPKKAYVSKAPKPTGKFKGQGASPKGRAAKVARPGVKPKNASRAIASTRGTRR